MDFNCKYYDAETGECKCDQCLLFDCDFRTSEHPEEDCNFYEEPS